MVPDPGPPLACGIGPRAPHWLADGRRKHFRQHRRIPAVAPVARLLRLPRPDPPFPTGHSDLVSSSRKSWKAMPVSTPLSVAQALVMLGAPLAPLPDDVRRHFYCESPPGYRSRAVRSKLVAVETRSGARARGRSWISAKRTDSSRHAVRHVRSMKMHEPCKPRSKQQASAISLS